MIKKFKEWSNSPVDKKTYNIVSAISLILATIATFISLFNLFIGAPTIMENGHIVLGVIFGFVQILALVFLVFLPLLKLKELGRRFE